MVDSGGHWTDLAAAQKLSQGKRVPGFVQEDVRRGALTDLLPVAQQTGVDLTWLRESVVGTSRRAAIGATLIWDEESDYDEVDRKLVIRYKQTALNKYVKSVYGTFNNYATIMAMEARKALFQGINDDLIYGNPSFGPSGSGEGGEPSGLHHLAATFPTTLNGTTNDVNIDEQQAGLSLANMRTLEDNMKYGVDFYLVPFQIWRRISAYAQEAGLSTNTFGQITFDVNQIGQRVMFWNGTRLVPSDYLVAENANTGVGSDARAKHNTGTAQFSIFAIKRGDPQLGQPGLSWNFGGEGASSAEPIMVEAFEKLEDFDAAGLRQKVYHNLADGSIMSIGRIFDITDAAIVA